ncbi:MAG: LysE family translocator [Spirulinaceae cyanobacterium]
MLFLQGVGIGLAIAAPVGVIGILCIQRTLTQGRWIGFVSGLGAATADGLYGCIAGLGLRAIADLLVAQRQGLMLGGGLFLIYLGISTWRQRPPQPEIQSQIQTETEPDPELGRRRSPTSPTITRSTTLRAYSSVLLLTLTNPMTIFSFLGIFSGLGLAQVERETPEAIALIAGVFTGSALWWLLLSTGVHSLSRWFGLGKLRWLNRISGVVIMAFGAIALGRFLQF